MLKTLPEGVGLGDVDIWFQDEARVGQRGTVTRAWARKGTRPRLTKQQQFAYAYLFGAVCPEKDLAVGLVLPVVNTRAMLEHLREISTHVPKGRHAVLVLDQAAWHTTAKVQVFDHLSLHKTALEHIKKHRIPLEMCLHSSFMAGMVHEAKDHPGLQLLQEGHPVALCTDDPLLFGACLSDELLLLHELLGWSVAQIEDLQQQVLRDFFFPE